MSKRQRYAVELLRAFDEEVVATDPHIGATRLKRWMKNDNFIAAVEKRRQEPLGDLYMFEVVQMERELREDPDDQ